MSKNRSHNVERELEEMYSQTFSRLSTGWTLEQARQEVKKAIEMCKEEAIKEGTANLPDNFGAYVIQAAESGERKCKRMVEKARQEGATDEDIREFLNLNDLQRRMVVWSEMMFRYSYYLSCIEKGLTADDAMTEIRKTFPMYGDPDNTLNTSGDDRLLPQELRGRIDAYREKMGTVYIKDRMKEYTSYNAFIRDEIRKGNL